MRALIDDRTPLAAWSDVAAPVLVIRGGETTVASRRMSDLLADALPQCRHAIVEDAGHMLPLTHAGALVDALLDHFDAT